MKSWSIIVLLGFLILGSGCQRGLRVEEPAGQKPEGMVWIPGGRFLMGGPGESACRQALAATDPKKPTCSLLRGGFTDSQPSHEVEVNGFWMDETEVTMVTSVSSIQNPFTSTSCDG